MLNLNMELELDCFECLVCGYVYNPEEEIRQEGSRPV